MPDVSHNEEAIFLAALEQGTREAQRAYVDRVTAGNMELRLRVLELLKSNDESRGPFDAPPPGLQATYVSPSVSTVGDDIGPYKLLEQIGEGGFGIVYMADQHEPVRRRVALKIIKPGMDSKQVLARFEAERHALAMMDHPNIARALDAGVTDSGRPYFVMELVRGVPITDYCDQNNLAVRERLGLFVNVCHAVQHAHQKGIIHRDIKPSNVLVTMSDGRPVPKVIDFGVAKAINQQLTEDTIFTRFAEMIGTPLYMSPEQAEMTSLDIDTRSDIYSLGVLLYELLTGTTPFEKERLKRAAFDEIRRIIREEEPAKPSTRISTLGETSASVSAHRHADPRRLSQIMRGDLDWIVMKALEKDRTRRYETANGLAMDIQRHLADEPVLAGPPSAVYRFRKFARRNKAALGMASVVAVALLLGIAGTAWQSYRAGQERDRAILAEREAEKNFRKAREAVDEYFNKVSENRLLDMPGLEPVRKELLESALKYYETFTDQHEDDPERQADLAVAYMRLAQIQYWNGDRRTRYLPNLEKGVDILEQLVREGRDTPDVQRRFVGCLRINAEARSYEPNDSPDPNPLGWKINLGCMARIPPILEKFVNDNPDVPEFRADLATAHLYCAKLEYSGRQLAECMISANKATDILEKLTREYPHEPKFRRDLAFVYEDKGKSLGVSTGQKKLAQEHLIKSLELREQLSREFPHVPGYRSQIGGVYGGLVDASATPAEAEKNARKSLDEFEKVAAEFPTLWVCRKDLATACLKLADLVEVRGDHVESLQLYQKGVDLLEDAVPESRVYWRDVELLAASRKKLVGFLQRDGREREARDVHRKSFAIAEKLVPTYPDADQYARLLTFACVGLSSYLVDAGRNDEAIMTCRRSVAILEKLSADVPKNVEFQVQLGLCYDELTATLRTTGAYAEAEQSCRKAIALKEELAADVPTSTEYRKQLGKSYLGLALVLHDLKQLQESADVCRRGVECFPKNAYVRNSQAWDMVLPVDSRYLNPICAVELAKTAVELEPTVGIIWNTLGMAHYRAGDWKAAISAYEKAMEFGDGGNGVDWFCLAMPYWQLGNKDLANKWYQAGVIWLSNYPTSYGDVIRIRAEAAKLLGLPETNSFKRDELLAMSAALVELVPRANTFQLRAAALARAGQWSLASENYDKAIAFRPTGNVVWYERCLVKLANEDKPGFQNACLEMLGQFIRTQDKYQAHFVAWSCALAPDALPNYELAIRLAGTAVTKDTTSAQLATGLGAILYRAGRFEEARQKLEAADGLFVSPEVSQTSPAYAWFFLAMTNHRLGRTDEAKRWLENAQQATDAALKDYEAGKANPTWNRRLTLILLRREAEALLGVKPSPAMQLSLTPPAASGDTRQPVEAKRP